MSETRFGVLAVPESFSDGETYQVVYCQWSGLFFLKLPKAAALLQPYQFSQTLDGLFSRPLNSLEGEVVLTFKARSFEEAEERKNYVRDVFVAHKGRQ